MSVAHPKKLIEVALPLPEINDASSYDKMPGIGPHPKGIHHWWARLPLPSARAVLFASVVTDPADDPAWKDKSEAEQDAERERLFGIVRRLMGKKLHEQPAVYAEARKEMLRHCDGELPPVLDPFAGGGSIPLEAARLGFPAHAADLNPVAVLLNKCNLELAPALGRATPGQSGRPPPHWRRAELAWHTRAGGGCSLLRPPHPRPRAGKRSATSTRRFASEGARRRRGQRHRMALGAHCQMLKSARAAQGCRCYGRSGFARKKADLRLRASVLDREKKTVRFEIKTSASPKRRRRQERERGACSVGNFIGKPELRRIATEHGVGSIPVRCCS